jgi:hypothetical protein
MKLLWGFFWVSLFGFSWVENNNKKFMKKSYLNKIELEIENRMECILKSDLAK